MNGSQTIKHGYIPKCSNEKDNNEGGGTKEDGFSDESVYGRKCCRVFDMNFHRIRIKIYSSCSIVYFTKGCVILGKVDVMIAS